LSWLLLTGRYEVLKGEEGLEEGRVFEEEEAGGLVLPSGMWRGVVWRIGEGGRGMCLFLAMGVGDEGRTERVMGRVEEGEKLESTAEREEDDAVWTTRGSRRRRRVASLGREMKGSRAKKMRGEVMTGVGIQRKNEGEVSKEGRKEGGQGKEERAEETKQN